MRDVVCRVRQRLHAGFRFPGINHDFVLRPEQLSAQPGSFPGSRHQVFDSRGALDRVPGLRNRVHLRNHRGNKLYEDSSGPLRKPGSRGQWPVPVRGADGAARTDVYQGSPAPATAFLAVGSKAAGVVLLVRLLFGVFPSIAAQWTNLLITISAITILYGSLCAIPQRNIKRLLGYSSIANAGYLLLGFAVLNENGSSAILYFLFGYLFTVLAAFTVITLVTRQSDSDDITVFAGLGQRSPFLAAGLTLSMVSLAGIPPLAGFFGKFLLLKAAVEQGAVNHGYYCLVAVAITGVIISLYYYFGVVRAIYWSKDVTDLSPIPVSTLSRIALLVCIGGMLWLGVLPDAPLRQAKQVAQSLTTGTAAKTPNPVLGKVTNKQTLGGQHP
jgi:NADH:ubiquinone oxidoreductase subunit 4 (subunit M)